MATENYPTYPDLANKVAVVTGGSRGIGASTKGEVRRIPYYSATR
jgi:hypothetical protein